MISEIEIAAGKWSQRGIRGGVNYDVIVEQYFKDVLCPGGLVQWPPSKGCSRV